MPDRSQGATVVALRPATRGITVNESGAAPQNGDEMALNRPNDRFSNRTFRAPGLNSAGDRASLLCLARFPHREHHGAFQSGASDDPTAIHDERCTLASHAI